VRLPRPPARTPAVLALVAVTVLGTAGCAADGTGEPTSAARTAIVTGPSSAAAAPGASAPAGPRAAPEARLIQVRVSAGRVSPAPGRVRVTVGERVRLVVRSDQADEIHVHGYDHTQDVEPGTPARLPFTADLQGAFEVELEGAHLLLGTLQVR
jgi:hypothetical protein